MPHTHISLRLRNAIRMAVAMSIGYIIIMIHQGPYSYYVPLTIAMVILPEVGATYRQGLLRMGGMILGGFAGIILVQLTSYGDMPFVVALSSITFVLMYFASYYSSKGVNDGYLFLVAYLALCLVYFKPVLNEGPLADYNYFFRILVSIFGVFIAMLSAAILWPNKASLLFFSQIEKIDKMIQQDMAKVSGSSTRIKLDFSDTDELLSQAAMENLWIKRREQIYRVYLMISARLYSADFATKQALATILKKVKERSLEPMKPSLSVQIEPMRIKRAIRGAIVSVIAPYLSIALSWPEATAGIITSVIIASVPPTKESAIKLSVQLFISTWVSCGLVTLLKIVYFPHVNRLPGLILAVFFLVALFGYIGSGKRSIEMIFKWVPLIFAGLMLSNSFYNNPNLEPAYRLAQGFSFGSILGAISQVVLWPINTKKYYQTQREELLSLQEEIFRDTSSGQQGVRKLLEFTQKSHQMIGDLSKVLFSFPPSLQRKMNEDLVADQMNLDHALNSFAMKIKGK